MTTCGFITHEKGTTKIKGHKSFASAVEYAKLQNKVTAVVSVCRGQAKVLTRCKDGGCGGGLSGVKRKKAARKKTASKTTKRRNPKRKK